MISPRTGGVIALLMLVACAAETGEAQSEAGAGPSAPESSGSGSTMPAIYLDQRVVSLRNDGINTTLRDYKFKLDICQEKGGPVRALSDGDVAKLGVTRLQRWFKADSAAYRREAFSYSGGAIDCQFALVSKGTHAYYDASRTVAIDLATNEKTTSEPEPDLLTRDFGMPLEEALEHEMATIETHAVVGPPSKQSVVGAPCLMWRSSVEAGNFCVWSGGTEWGFSIGPSAQDLDNRTDMLYSLVLKQERGPRQAAKITTEQFVVGASFGNDVMKPKPSTASVSRSEGAG